MVPRGGARGYQALDSDARTYIAAVEAADGTPLENAVRAALDTFFAGVKTDNGGSLSAFGQIILLAGPRTVNGAMSAYGTAPTNVNFVSGDLSRQGGLLSDGSTKSLALNRNGNSDAQDSRHLYARITLAAPQDSTRIILGDGVTTTGANNIRHTIAAFQGYVSSSLIGTTHTMTTGGYGFSRSNSSNVQRLMAGVTSSPASTSATPLANAMNAFGSGSNRHSGRIAVISTGANVDLAAFDARVTTYLAALAAAGI
jgi:hypothetical protein